MGRVVREGGKEAAKPAKDAKSAKGDEAKEDKDDTPEDPPLVKQLKEIDDKYLELEKEYERECQKLLTQFAEKQQPLLEERKKLLTTPSEEASQPSGTPALASFWLTALQNHPAVEEAIHEWDAPVLEYLADVEREHIAEADDVSGFRLKFHFTENPYFSNRELKKEYRMVTANPYCGQIEVKSIECTTIDWKAGKDVTVEKVAKKVKGGGAKKAKQKKEKEEPRPSFFRDFFRNLRPEMELPPDARMYAQMLLEDEEGEDEEALLACLMEQDHDIGTALRDNVIPFAVRWYTGEAAPDMGDDDDEDEEEEELDEDEEEDSDEGQAERAKGRGKGGRGGKAASGAARGKPKGAAKASAKAEPAAGENKEECKQQ